MYSVTVFIVLALIAAACLLTLVSIIKDGREDDNIELED